MESNFIYTPRTCGALHEQLEFDFNHGFTKADNEPKVETNTTEIKLRGHNNKPVSKKAGE